MKFKDVDKETRTKICNKHYKRGCSVCPLHPLCIVLNDFHNPNYHSLLEKVNEQVVKF